MSTTDFRQHLRTGDPQFWIALIGVAVALSPANTKIAGAAWLFICVAGAVVAFQSRKVRVDLSDGVAAASRAWLVCCAVSAALATALALYRPHGPDSLHAEYRLLAAAAAVHVLVRKRSWSLVWRSLMLPAVAMACVTALLQVAVTPDRLFLPSNALPWAVSVAFFLCLLLPRLFSAQVSTNRRWWGVAAVAGLLAVLMSQSRGAYGVLLLPLWLAGSAWRQTHLQARLGRLATAGVAAMLLLAASAWHPADPLRLRLAVTEVSKAQAQGDYNTSMGARVYLWSLAWHGFTESPLVGIGGQERLKRIHEAGLDLPDAQRSQLAVVRKVGHVHNQYLHAAMDGGLVGLAATLAVLAGLAAGAFKLRRIDRVASQQLAGLLLMHATASLTNVNMAHNYYAVMLALAVSLVLLGARRTPGDPAAAADRPEPAAAR